MTKARTKTDTQKMLVDTLTQNMLPTDSHTEANTTFRK